MKRKVLLNALILVLAGLSINFSSKAQTYVLSTAPGQSIDTVTVGGRYAYKVDPDATIAGWVTSGIMNPSVFQWVFSNGQTVLKEDGSGNATAVGTEPGYFVENAISAVMPAAPGLIRVVVNEKSQPKIGNGCAGDTTGLGIRVVPVATINFTGTQEAGACAAQNYSIPLSLTGYGPWKINYTISYNGGAATPFSVTIGNAGQAVGTTALTSLTLDVTSAQLASGVGTYDVQIANVSDRFMQKALNTTPLTGGLPTTNSYKLYVYPTPAAPTIQHQRNL